MKKRQYLIFFSVVSCILGVMIWMIYFRADPQGYLSMEFVDQEVFKLNEEVDPITLVTASNSSRIIYPSVDTSTPGEKNLLFIAIDDNGKQKEFMKTIIVISPVPPILTLKESEVTITQGESFNPRDYVSESHDEYDGKLKPSISGEYDCSKAGTYTIDYQSENSSGLVSKAQLQLTVKEKEVVVTEKPSQSSPSEHNSSHAQEVPKAEEPPVTAPQTPSYQGKREWLLVEGYSFTSAQSACMEAGKQSNQTYTCEVIWDDHGLAIGYQLLY